MVEKAFDEATELRRFYEATSAPEARSILGALLHESARPVVERVVRRRLRDLGGRGSASDEEDLVGDAILRLAQVLMGGRQGEAPVANLPAYAARTAEHACDEHYRRRFRIRYNVMKRVQTHLRRNEAFYEWRAGPGAVRGALSAWPPPPPSPQADRAGELEHDPARAAERILRDHPAAKDAPPKTAHCMAAGLRWCAGALPIDDLVRLVQAARNEFDAPDAELDENVRANTPEPTEDGEFLGAAWAAIRGLRTNQARALLLNLRIGEAVGPEVFELFGLADLREVATVLEMDRNRFEAEVLPTLPWPDRRIAELLRCTEAQVSGLRSTARRALAARLGTTRFSW